MSQSQATMQSPRVVFNLPDGKEQVNPPTESLRDFVLNRGDEFWATGSGQAALEFKGAEAGSRLLLTGLQSAGFFLIYEPAEGDPLAATNPTTTEQEMITVYIGGEPMEIPNGNFIDRETAWRIIGDFLHDGKPSPRVTWEPWL
jgi:Immunity protein Imm1